jgi:excisionase family DNA binding protein
MEDFMTTKEAAEILDVELETVSRLVKRGVLKGTKFGRAWMVERASVDDFLKRTKGKSKFDPTRRKAD